MRTSVSFQYPAEFVPLSDEDLILSASAVDWFHALLQRVPDLILDDEPCQEDWGVVFFAQRHGRRFWIGLSTWHDDEAWISHVHHHALFQLLSSSAKRALRSLLADLHGTFESDPNVRNIRWYTEREAEAADPIGHATPT